MKIKLFIFGKQRTLLSFNISHYKNTTSQGKPLSFTLGSEKLHIRFVQEQGDEAFLNWMLLKDENTQEYGYYERGKIVVYDNSGLDKKLQEYDFIAKPIAYQSVFHHEKGLVINMTLSADKMLVYNDKFYIKPYYYPKEHTEQRKEKEEKPTIEVTEMFFTDDKENKIQKGIIGQEIYLVIKGKNLSGEETDLVLIDDEIDFEYKGKRLENDILKGYIFENDEEERISLKVVEPKN
ncbi:type VI secretion system tube protein TssD [Capnocytophaga canis]|uniref:type VI secretion system tube protein TssD n=1 Tax=Capnocytophaga canis TaxID=1848903 RepID=UPI0037D4B8FB